MKCISFIISKCVVSRRNLFEVLFETSSHLHTAKAAKLIHWVRHGQVQPPRHDKSISDDERYNKILHHFWILCLYTFNTYYLFDNLSFAVCILISILWFISIYLPIFLLVFLPIFLSCLSGFCPSTVWQVWVKSSRKGLTIFERAE